MKREHVQRMIDTALDRLAEALEQGQSDTLKAYLEMLGRFHRYSFGNVLLIAMQRPDATHVAGFRTWQTLGRYVKSGEKAIRIFAPIIRKLAAKEKGDNKDTEEMKSLVAFRTVCVFDIGQTEGKELPAFSAVRGTPGALTVALREFAKTRGIEVQDSISLGAAQGASCGGQILIRKGLPPAEEFSTLVHEIAHELLHRDSAETSKTIRETEAEAVAFVVCQSAGLDTNTAASDYIQLYQGNRDVLRESLERIQCAAQNILDAVLIRGTQEAAIPQLTSHEVPIGDIHRG